LLWANKNDLSLSSGNSVSNKVENLVDLLDSFKENILCDHSEDLWQFLNQLREKKSQDDKKIRVDVFLDNCSIELAADLLLTDFLLRNDFVDEVYLHGKPYYWFISDVTQHDFDYLLRQIQSSNSLVLNNFYRRMKKYLDEKRVVLDCTNHFWTSPHSLFEMEAVQSQLYSDLKLNSSLVIMKGDLNYRKLLGDLNWPFDTPLKTAVNGFLPTSLCAVRTIKADLVANLDTNVSTNKNYALCKEKHSDSKKWMISGDYGLIQFLRI
jgi:hypothetical protein